MGIYRFTLSKLLVIIGDRLSELYRKGELTNCYYNPGELFKEVHILMTNDDKPDIRTIQQAVGGAKLYLHNLPADKNLFMNSFGWQPFLMKKWIRKGVAFARDIQPDLIRTHSSFLEGYLAKEIKIALGVPYIISIHGLWDRGYLMSFKEKAIKVFRNKLERSSLSSADGVIAVYKPIFERAKQYNPGNTQLIYNIVGNGAVERKSSYAINGRPRLITVNRQMKGKNPENIIRAIRDIGCYYLIIGDGEYHKYLKHLAKKLNCSGEIDFVKSIPNDKLCAMLKDFDLMVSNCGYSGISKGVLEAALAGLPVVLNKQRKPVSADIEGGWVLLCEDNTDSYRKAILTMLADEPIRKEYGMRAYNYAKNNFDPPAMEEKTVNMYLEILNRYN